MAVLAGVELLALTDHDTVDGVLALQQGVAASCVLLPGIELSCLWRKRPVHVVGLGIDPRALTIEEAVAMQRALRFERARQIDDKLRRRGITGAYEGALVFAGDAAPCRPHFARFLVQDGHCKDAKDAFGRFLGNRQLKGANQHWPGLERVVSWIVAAGGVAVLAHPDDYRLTRSKLVELLREFIDAGGVAMELAGLGKPDASALALEQLCREFALGASVGSDFHGGANAWRKLGWTREIPADLTPVWELL